DAGGLCDGRGLRSSHPGRVPAVVPGMPRPLAGRAGRAEPSAGDWRVDRIDGPRAAYLPALADSVRCVPDEPDSEAPIQVPGHPARGSNCAHLAVLAPPV